MSAHGEKKTPWDRYFIFASAVVMGMCTGAFFYVTVYAPEYSQKLDIAEQLDPDAVVIHGAMYGGCQRANRCATFVLSDDYKYEYEVSPEAEIVKGKIQKEIADSLFDSLASVNVSNLDNEIVPKSCASHADGLDYLYDVTIDGDTYTLDTCTTLFAQNSTLQKDFLAVWSFMDNPTTTYPVLIEEGFLPAVVDRFNNPPNEDN